MRIALYAATLVALLTGTRAFYLPGLAPLNYCEKSHASATCPVNVTLFVNKLNSDQSVIPYEYHSFDFCVGSENGSSVENLDQVFVWRAHQAEIAFKEPQSCALLCQKDYKASEPDHMQELKLLQKGMKLNYQHHWIIDSMPVTFCFINQHNMKVCTTGFPMGCYVTPVGKPKTHACSTLGTASRTAYTSSTLEYRDMSNDPNFLEDKIGGRIISIKVQPRSIEHKIKDIMDCSFAADPQSIPNGEKDVSVVYSYSIVWEKTNVNRDGTTFSTPCRTQTSPRPSAADSTAGIMGAPAGLPVSTTTPVNSTPAVQKFRPFTMSLMADVLILFVDIAGFTKMSSNKPADELVNLLNDLFGRFDYLCGRCNLEKISTLG